MLLSIYKGIYVLYVLPYFTVFVVVVFLNMNPKGSGMQPERF